MPETHISGISDAPLQSFENSMKHSKIGNEKSN
jgi:hypothetical protein